MDEDENIPRFSYDLIEWLDRNIAAPSFPLSAEGFADLDARAVRRAAFTSGGRQLVDMLIAWRDEGEADDEVAGVVDGPAERYPPVFGEGGDVRGSTPSVRVAGLPTEPLSSDGDRD